MFNLKPTDKVTRLEQTLDALFDEMTGWSGDSQEYAKMVDQVSKLYSLKEIDSTKRVSPDTMALVIGNLAGIILIVGHERMNVVTSKALSFVLKLR